MQYSSYGAEASGNPTATLASGGSLREHPRPRKPGKLLPPGQQAVANGMRYVSIAFSAADVIDPRQGANAQESVLEQIRHGPVSWSMFISCAGLAFPGVMHLLIRQHWLDYCLGVGWFCIGTTSSLCDSFCVHSNVYDPAQPYMKTAAHVGIGVADVAAFVQNHEAQTEILANDRWNNLTRLLDRSAIITFVPFVISFAAYQRPRTIDFLVFAVLFFSAWITCGFGNYYQMKNPCGILRSAIGELVVEDEYQFHQRLHKIWHFSLILLMSASAIYRPPCAAAVPFLNSFSTWTSC